MTDDYIELTDPKEILRHGDECQSQTFDSNDWLKCVSGFGVPIGAFAPGMFRFRRLRSVVIRDAAEALLREEYRKAILYLGEPGWQLHERNFPEWKALREALGLTVVELRGEA